MTSRIRRARELSGLTMGQASHRLAIPLVTLSDYELGKATPDTAARRAIADCYGVSEAWLAGADPVVPKSTRDILHAADISSDEREALLELFGSMGHQPGADHDPGDEDRTVEP